MWAGSGLLRCPGPILDGVGWVGAPILDGWFRCGLGWGSYPRWMVQVWAGSGLLRCPGPILDGWFRCGLGWGSYVDQDLS